jgi:iron-sulfur cluster repair protein YtfE (RIC family)
MKRSEALVQLSRDHHHGLYVAQQLARASQETAAAARGAFLAFWEQEGNQHFRVEEEVVLPAFARHGSPEHEAVVRVLTDHVALRRLAADLAADPLPAPEALNDLGERLRAHIRHEERVLFPLIEEALPEEELVALAAGVERAHGEQA